MNKLTEIDLPLFADSDFYLDGDLSELNIYQIKLRFAQEAANIANKKLQEALSLEVLDE